MKSLTNEILKLWNSRLWNFENPELKRSGLWNFSNQDLYDPGIIVFQT